MVLINKKTGEIVRNGVSTGYIVDCTPEGTFLHKRLALPPLSYKEVLMPKKHYQLSSPKGLEVFEADFAPIQENRVEGRPGLYDFAARTGDNRAHHDQLGRCYASNLAEAEKLVRNWLNGQGYVVHDVVVGRAFGQNLDLLIDPQGVVGMPLELAFKLMAAKNLTEAEQARGYTLLAKTRHLIEQGQRVNDLAAA